jgi:hypothetical protein
MPTARVIRAHHHTAVFHAAHQPNHSIDRDLGSLTAQVWPPSVVPLLSNSGPSAMAAVRNIPDHQVVHHRVPDGLDQDHPGSLTRLVDRRLASLGLEVNPHRSLTRCGSLSPRAIPSGRCATTTMRLCSGSDHGTVTSSWLRDPSDRELDATRVTNGATEASVSTTEASPLRPRVSKYSVNPFERRAGC